MAAKKRKHIPGFHEKVPSCASISGQNSVVFLHVRVLMFTCSSETYMSFITLVRFLHVWNFLCCFCVLVCVH